MEYILNKNKLKAELVKREMTIEQFALACDVESASLSKMLSGKTKTGNLVTLLKISDYCGIDNPKHFLTKITNE